MTAKDFFVNPSGAHAADFVLRKADLGILHEGMDEGRRTFANTMKYIFTTISANFGNMFSMPGASLLLPFLPLLAPEILPNNFSPTFPPRPIASDNVDAEQMAKPRRWNTTFIRNYMVVFGLASTVFGFATFGALLLWSSVGFMSLALAIPHLPFDAVFGFVPLPAPLMLTIIGLTAGYVAAVEMAKRYFYLKAATGA